MTVSGATAEFMPIAVGHSFEDRGMRNDQQDAVALALRARGASQPTDLDAEEARQVNKRKRSLPEDSTSPRGASQPAERGTDAAHDEMKQLWEALYDGEYDPTHSQPASPCALLEKRKASG